MVCCTHVHIGVCEFAKLLPHIASKQGVSVSKSSEEEEDDDDIEIVVGMIFNDDIRRPRRGS